MRALRMRGFLRPRGEVGGEYVEEVWRVISLRCEVLGVNEGRGGEGLEG